MDGVDGQISSTDDDGGQQPAADGGNGDQGEPTEEIAPNSWRAPPQYQVTPAVTWSTSSAAYATINSLTAQTTATMSLHRNGTAGH